MTIWIPWLVGSLLYQINKSHLQTINGWKIEHFLQIYYLCVCVCVRATHCVEVPDPLEGEPLPQAHPDLLSKRSKPTAAQSTYLNHTKNTLSRWQSFFRHYLGQEIHADSWPGWSHASVTHLRISLSYPSNLYYVHVPYLAVNMLSPSYYTVFPIHTRSSALWLGSSILLQTHRQLSFHSDTPPSGNSYHEGEGTKVGLPITLQHSSHLSTLLLFVHVQIRGRQDHIQLHAAAFRLTLKSLPCFRREKTLGDEKRGREKRLISNICFELINGISAGLLKGHLKWTKALHRREKPASEHAHSLFSFSHRLHTKNAIEFVHMALSLQ